MIDAFSDNLWLVISLFNIDSPFKHLLIYHDESKTAKQTNYFWISWSSATVDSIAIDYCWRQLLKIVRSSQPDRYWDCWRYLLLHCCHHYGSVKCTRERKCILWMYKLVMFLSKGFGNLKFKFTFRSLWRSVSWDCRILISILNRILMKCFKC